MESGGDLSAGLPVGDQLEDAALGGGEVGERRFLLRQFGSTPATANEKRRERWADVFLTGRDRLDALNDLGRGAVLQHVSVDAEVERGIEVMFVLVHRQQ